MAAATLVSVAELDEVEDSADDGSDRTCGLEISLSDDSVDRALVRYKVSTIDELKYGPAAEELIKMVDNVVSSGCEEEESSLEMDGDELVELLLTVDTSVVLLEIVTLSVIEERSIVIDLVSGTTDCDVTGADLVVGNDSKEVDGLYVLSGVSVALNMIDVVVV